MRSEFNLEEKKDRDSSSSGYKERGKATIIKYLSIFFIDKFLEGNKEMAERG